MTVFLSPHKPSASQFALRFGVNLAIALVLAVYCGLGLIVVLPALVIGAGILACSRLRWAWNLLAVLVLPSVFAFSWGSATYWLGSATLRFMGYPGHPIGLGVDPDTRVRHESGGCMVVGGEWLVTAPHNAAVRFHTFLFGPMRGTYQGSWPTLAESRLALQNGVSIPLVDRLAGKITVQGNVFFLDDRGRGLTEDLARWISVCEEDECVRGAVTNSGNLVFEFFDVAEERRSILVPIGNQPPYNGRPLGMYLNRNR